MDRIVADPGIIAGVPRTHGTPAMTIAWLLAENVTIDEVLRCHPQLTVRDVQACRVYTAQDQP